MATSREGNWAGRAAVAGSIKAISYHVMVTYVIPIGAPIMTGAVGYFEGYPWMFILTAAALTFGGMATGLVRFDEWLGRRSVKEKLGFSSVRALKDVRGGNGFALGVAFNNLADVPIEFEIEEISSRLVNRVPEKRSFDLKRFVIPPRGRGWFDDHIIDITPPSPGTIEGLIECKLKYGRVGRRQYDLLVRKQVVLSFNEDGLPGPSSWNDTAS
jgi:hypothetical protein